MSVPLNVLYGAYLEWRAVHATLEPREKREFARWILRVHPEIAEAYKGDPAGFRLACREMQRGRRGFTPRGIGEAVLHKHLTQLLERYHAISPKERGTLLEFLNTVLEKHPTERALKRYLRTS